MADILDASKHNLNNWTKNFNFTFDDTYEDGNNTIEFAGTDQGYERVYIPVNVKKNRNYVFRFKLCSPTGFTLGGYGSDEQFAFVTATEPSQSSTAALQYNRLGRTTAFDNEASETPVTYEASFNSGSYTVVYIAIDFGYITDNTNFDFEIDDVELDNTVPTPTEYLHYIESDGGQYINLDYTPTANTKIELTCRIIQNSDRSYEALFGSRYRNYNNNAFVFFARFNNENKPVYNRSGAETPGSGLIYGKDITLTCYRETSDWVDVHGNTGTLVTGGTPNGGAAPLFLFDLNNAQSTGGLNPDGSRSKMRVIGLKIYEGDTLKRYYRPALDSNNVGYLYETVERYDYRNAGTGTFTYGKQLYYLIQSGDKLYRIENGAPVELDETQVTAQLFINYGFYDLPLWSQISSLANPKVLVWRNSATGVSGNARVRATPLAQTIFTPAYDMTDSTILGIETVHVDASEDVTFAFSFDSGQTWKMYNGTAWAILSEGDTGMSVETMRAIPTEAWALVAVTGSFKIRATLFDADSYIGSLVVDYLNADEEGE